MTKHRFNELAPRSLLANGTVWSGEPWDTFASKALRAIKPQVWHQMTSWYDGVLLPFDCQERRVGEGVDTFLISEIQTQIWAQLKNLLDERKIHGLQTMQ